MIPRLPITPGPADNETVGSYLGRLTEANHLPSLELRSYLAKPSGRASTTSPIDPDRLAAASGHSPARLRRALPELRVGEVDWRRFHRDPLPACPRCHGVGVHRFTDNHLYACLRHRRWIGPPDYRTTGESLDVSRVPEILAAQARHRNLLHRHGRAAMAEAFADSRHIHVRWAQRGEFTQHSRSRLDVLLDEPGRVIHLGEDAFHASIYPETVALAGLLASPYWRHLAEQPLGEQTGRFYTEAARRIGFPGYNRYYAVDPLGRWVDAQQEIARNAPRRRELDFSRRYPRRSRHRANDTSTGGETPSG